MAGGTLKCIAVAEIDRMLEPPIRRSRNRSGHRLVEGRVANCTIVSDHLTGITLVLPVMAAKTSNRVEVPNVVDMA